jgi:NAD(P)H-flavin reductase
MTTFFQPLAARLARIEPLIADHALFTFAPVQPLPLAPGQFVEISLPGVGAFPVSACEIPGDGRLISCIRRAGRVTDALFRLVEGSEVGLRGPFGKGFPFEAFHGRDALLVAGGLGMAPLRALLRTLLDLPGREGRIILLYGAREPESLLFHDELMALAAAGRITLRLSVDFAEELPGPASGVLCQVGLVPELLDGLEFNPQRTTAALCGPPALYRCVLDELAAAGIPPELIFATLERRMRCGIGECCHCVTGGVFVCCEGPVFSLARLRTMEGAI